jgi:D-amino peptidase
MRVLVAMAAAHGIPTAGIAGDHQACQEAADWVPQVEQVPVKWGLGFRAARMLSPAAAQTAVRTGIERALRRLSGIPVWEAACGPQELTVRYAHEARAERAARGPGAWRVDAHTVSVRVVDCRAIPDVRFLFARPRSPDDAATAEER